jgi:transcriptional regulator NrdR family protein
VSATLVYSTVKVYRRGGTTKEYVRRLLQRILTTSYEAQDVDKKHIETIISSMLTLYSKLFCVEDNANLKNYNRTLILSGGTPHQQLY